MKRFILAACLAIVLAVPAQANNFAFRGGVVIGQPIVPVQSSFAFGAVGGYGCNQAMVDPGFAYQSAAFVQRGFAFNGAVGGCGSGANFATTLPAYGFNGGFAGNNFGFNGGFGGGFVGASRFRFGGVGIGGVGGIRRVGAVGGGFRFRGGRIR